MSLESQMGGNGALFIGEDKTVRLELLDPAGVPVDMTGWTVEFVVSRRDKTALADALIREVATISGAYNMDRSLNEQRAVVVLDDEEHLNTTKFRARDDDFDRYGWARTDDGSRTMLAHGPFVPEKSPPLPTGP